MAKKSIDLSWIIKDPIAHRGLHDTVFPENSLGSFQAAIKNNFPIEIDLQLTKDQKLVVFHDYDLQRMCGYPKKVIDCDLDFLTKLTLLKTSELVPSLKDTLNLVNGQVPLLIEIKTESFNKKIIDVLVSELNDYQGLYAVQCFNPKMLHYLKKRYPSIIRGILSCEFKLETFSFLKRIILSKMYLNFWIKPHFIAYQFQSLKKLNIKKYQNKNIVVLAWTLRSQDDTNKIKCYCQNIIFEGFIPIIDE